MMRTTVATAETIYVDPRALLKNFLTFDHRQQALAKIVGLKVQAV